MNANIIDLLNVGVVGGNAVEPTIVKNGQTVNTDYGIMKHKTDSSFFIKISTNGDDKITKLRAATSCGCTTAKPKLVGNEYLIKVKYDTKRFGSIRKTVTVTFEFNGEAQKIFFKLIGKVVS